MAKYAKAVDEYPVKDLRASLTPEEELAYRKSMNAEQQLQKKSMRKGDAGELDRLSVENKIALKEHLETRLSNNAFSDRMNIDRIQKILTDLEIGIRSDRYITTFHPMKSFLIDWNRSPKTSESFDKTFGDEQTLDATKDKIKNAKKVFQ